ncbi:hypothetical protein ABZY09_09820 [Streptomyces sp. NPDC002928]|uniref:hypothetical protein n=1 Tax=Streptomyces sp. NPDC002928 TaxID=3154440 RepID=UPI0033A7C3FF
MLDDMSVLREAVAGYRVAATAAGLTWPKAAAASEGQPPELVHRLFDVERIPEQVTWLMSQGWEGRLLPGGGLVMPWPTDGGALDDLSLSIGVPFLWRHQLPLFHFEHVYFTIVLTGDHEGEIWRYTIPPDTWDAARAATSLASLFTTWTRAIEVGFVHHDSEHNRWLTVGDGSGNDDDTIRKLQQLAPGLDPLTFPIYMPDHPLTRARQVECGVDMSSVDEDRAPEIMEELLDEIDAIRASIGL